MTIEEARQTFPLMKIKASKGDNLNRMTWRIYGSLEEKYSRTLTALNVRFDWNSIKPGDEIKFFTAEVVDMIW